MYEEIKGDLIDFTKEGMFDVITHGCNCFCTMGAGIAPIFAKEFFCDDYPLENPKYKGDIRKLGNIEWQDYILDEDQNIKVSVVNSYTQYRYDRLLKPFDYDAFTLCMRKINNIFPGKRIGLPKIGAGLAGGDWEVIKKIIQKELKDCNVTVVIYNK